MMRKTIMILGKCLIIFSLLWPVPFGFIMYPWFGYKIDMPMWGVERGYWWPLLIILVIGIMLCLLSRYKSRSADAMKKAQLKDTMLAKALKLLNWGTLLIIVFFLVTLVIIALYYLFFTPMIYISVPVCAAIGVSCFLVYLGVRHYNNHKDNEE